VAYPMLAKDILRYFLDHPDAADDLEGVVHWRMQQMILENAIAQADEALQWLAERQYLTQEQRRSSRPIFRLNLERQHEATSFLREDE
jgi:hypothetical protein